MGPETKIQDLSELPYFKDEHRAALSSLGIATLNDLALALEDEKRSAEIVEHLVGIGPKTISSWRTLLVEAVSESPGPDVANEPIGSVESSEQVLSAQPMPQELEAEPLSKEALVEAPVPASAGPALEKIEGTLNDLMAINSSKAKGRRSIAQLVAKKLTEVGLTVTVVGSEDAPAIVGVHGQGGLVMACQLDTYPRDEMRKKDQGRRVGEYIYGRGSGVKGISAVAIALVEDLVKRDVPVTVLFTTDDTSDRSGAQELSQSKLITEAKGVVLLRPTEMAPVVNKAGSCLLDITLVGEDPIVQAAKLINFLKSDLQEASLRSGISVTVYYIRGGKKKMASSPNTCEVRLTVHYNAPVNSEDILNMVKGRLGNALEDLKVRECIEPFNGNTDSPLIKALLDQTNKTARTMYSTADAFAAVRKNPNAAIFGPGKDDPKGCEFVPVKDLEAAYAILDRLAVEGARW
jgi:acetylornithine deacetylase/succinyl-diaminopimelate desuccinylase-like protein